METKTQPDTRLQEQVLKLEKELSELRNEVENNKDNNSVCLVCFSGSWDKLFAALTIASGSLALGMEVHIFFSFWSINALRKNSKYIRKNKSLIQDMFSQINPAGFSNARLSKFNFGGLGKFFLRKMMKVKGIDDVDTLFADIEELGAKIYVCDTSAQLFGINCKELSPKSIIQCGSTTFLAKGMNSKMTLFI